MLPGLLEEPLRLHLARVRALHEGDVAKGLGRVFLPYALAEKYPNANAEWALPTCWSVATTSERSRSSSATEAYGPP